MHHDDATEVRPAGRPRDPKVDELVRKATVECLIEDGYARLSIGAVAQRAGVGHSSVYRRWPSKAYLVHEVLFPTELSFDPPPGTPLPEVVRALASGMITSLSRPEARAALPGLLAEWHDDPELRRRLIGRLEPQARRALRRAASEAAERGEVRQGVDIDRVYDAVLGTAFASLFVNEGLSGEALAESLVDLLLGGILTRTPNDGGSRERD